MAKKITKSKRLKPKKKIEEKVRINQGMPVGALFHSKYLNVWALCDLYLRKYPDMPLYEMWEKLEPIIRKEFPHSRANLHTLRSYRTRFRNGESPKTQLPLTVPKKKKRKEKKK